MRIVAALLTILLFGVFPASAPADVKISEKSKKQIALALEWLASQQNANGSYSDGSYPQNTAMTAFAMLAFMSQGNLPNQGIYGPEVAKAAKFLMSCARPEDGVIAGPIGAGNGMMYGHAMATLALAELWGQTGDDELRPILKKSVELIVGCQNYEGGWRYQPQPTGADISATIIQVMALRACKNAGLNVPDSTMKRAIEYVKDCYEPSIGAFSYQIGSGRVGPSRTAAGMCVLFLTGEYKANELPKAIEYLTDNFDMQEHFFYGHYYASHAMHQVGGKVWEDWYRRLESTLLPRQSSDGSWSIRFTRNDVGPVYQTSIAVIALSVPASYLPIYQR